MLHQSW